MNDAQQAPVRGRTRWVPFAVVVGAGLAASVLMLAGVANGSIGTSITVSGSTFKVSASELDGTGFVQYGGQVKTAKGPVAVAYSGIKNVTKLSDLCQSVVLPGTPISLVIHAGKTTPATATDMLIAMDQLSGDAEFTNINIGQDAGTLQGGPAIGGTGTDGTFGQQADTVKITNLRQVAWSTTAGTFNLNGLDLHISTSGEQCFP